MKLYTVQCGKFKLDGGAMFGVVPKSLWQKTNPADERNLIDLGCRSLLIEDGEKLILVDTGLGDKQDEKFFGHYALWGEENVDNELARYGFHRDDITDVFLTHLHFDHCGGAIEWDEDKSAYRPAFKNAKFWSNEAHWQWATKPNPRERASFLPENIVPIQESGQLNFVPLPKDGNKVSAPELKMDIFFCRRAYREADAADGTLSGENGHLHGRSHPHSRAYPAGVHPRLRHAPAAHNG